MIIATGESSMHPKLHIWSIVSLEPLNIIQTQHTGGIYQTIFSADGTLIATIGMDKYNSIQITDWKNQDIYAFRSTSVNPILDLMFNPNNCNEIATCGPYNVTEWKLNGRSLIWQIHHFLSLIFLSKSLTMIKHKDKLMEPTIITCLAYANFKVLTYFQY